MTPTNENDKRDLMRRQIPADVWRVFDFCEPAERVIAAMKKLHPARAAEIHACFSLLVPMVQMPFWLYERHCEELITRYLAGWSYRDMELATNAEILLYMSMATLAAPPGNRWFHLQMKLFNELAPLADVRRLWNAPGFTGDEQELIKRGWIPEPYEGSDEELLLQLRKRGRKARNRVNLDDYGVTSTIAPQIAPSRPVQLNLELF